MSKLQQRDPVELTIHPALKLVADWGKEDPRANALTDDIRARGINQALFVDGRDQVIDGRKRLRSAKALQLQQVPVVVREDSEVLGVIVNSLVQRAHYTKSQLAYMLAPLLEDAFKESERRRLSNLAKNPNNLRSELSSLRAKSVEDWAEQIGITTRLFQQARELHELFRKHPEKRDLTDEEGNFEEGTTFKAFYEARIMRPVPDGREKPYGLGACIAGIKASLSGKVRRQEQPKQMELFGQAFESLAVRWQRIAATPGAQEAVKAYVADLPDDLCEVIEAAIRARKRRAE